jgi:hypothetical protein
MSIAVALALFVTALGSSASLIIQTLKPSRCTTADCVLCTEPDEEAECVPVCCIALEVL